MVTMHWSALHPFADQHGGTTVPTKRTTTCDQNSCEMNAEVGCVSLAKWERLQLASVDEVITLCSGRIFPLNLIGPRRNWQP